ncbi:MAG: hypothetical protein LBU76_09420 [Azoarcus sp.]|nr:hypothetical protein [Azoarcus sp.]
MTAPPALAANEAEAAPAERIEQLRSEGERMRAKAESDYQAKETACYKRFFVNRCIDDAKAERLNAILRARELEAEAHRVDIAERQRKAAEVAKKAEERGLTSRPMEATSPSAERDTPKVRPLKSTRSRSRNSSRTNSASARAKAAQRAEAARRDRERYDARIRELEEKKARDADGR